MLPPIRRPGMRGRLKRGWKDDGASQIVEVALSLPLLVLLVVGIFDFSTAISLKQKLTNAAREGARVAAADPYNDMGTATAPVSVMDAYSVVDNYLLSENISDCGLKSALPSHSAGTLTWVSTATGAPCTSTSGLILTINRGSVTKETLSTTGTVDVITTVVTIQYPYNWQFGGVVGLVGGRFIGPTSITTSAAAFNEN